MLFRSGIFDITGGVTPLAFRSALGFRFFFTDNIGLVTEFGAFGGGTIVGGLSVKL